MSDHLRTLSIPHGAAFAFSNPVPNRSDVRHPAYHNPNVDPALAGSARRSEYPDGEAYDTSPTQESSNARIWLSGILLLFGLLFIYFLYTLFR